MKMLSFKSRKTLLVYTFTGMTYSLLMIYAAIPLSDFFGVPYTWNRNVWSVIIIICTIALSLIERKIYKIKTASKYLWLLVTAISVVFITSWFFAMILIMFTPWSITD